MSFINVVDNPADDQRGWSIVGNKKQKKALVNPKIAKKAIAAIVSAHAHTLPKKSAQTTNVSTSATPLKKTTDLCSDVPVATPSPTYTLNSFDVDESDVNSLFDAAVKSDKANTKSAALVSKEAPKKEAQRKEETQHKSKLSAKDGKQLVQSTAHKLQANCNVIVSVPKVIDHTPGLKKFTGSQISLIRFSQDSISEQTRDGITVTELAKRIYQRGFIPACAIHVVTMQGKVKASNNTPMSFTCQTSFDNRRLVAANLATAMHPKKEITVYAYEHESNSEITNEKILRVYKQMLSQYEAILAGESSKSARKWYISSKEFILETWGYAIALRLRLGNTCPMGVEKFGYLRPPKIL